MRLSAIGMGAAAALLALPASACPEGREAARAGVVVTFDDESLIRYVLGDDDIVAETARYGDVFDIGGDGYDVVAVHGIYMLEDHEVAEGERLAEYSERMSFVAGLSALPAPEPGLVWSGTSEAQLGDEPAFERTVAVSIGAAGTLAIGACSYESWPVVVRHLDEFDDVLIGLEYLPSLGISLFVSFAGFGEAAEVYAPLEIAAAD